VPGPIAASVVIGWNGGAGAARESGGDAANDDARREGRVQPVHHPDAHHRFDRVPARVDRDVERA
jgi:hypothetical protein